MKKKYIVSAFIFSMLAISSFSFKNSVVDASQSTNGYHVDEIIKDKFNKGTLDSSWTLNGAETVKNYYAMHCISPCSYGSGPIINAVTLSNKTRYDFTIYPEEGISASNISFNIGIPTPSTEQKEPTIDCRVQFWDQQLVFVNYHDNLQLPTGDLSGCVLRGFGGLYSDLLRTDVSLYIERKTNRITEIYAEYRRNGEIVYSSESTPFQLIDPRHPNGYCGFFWDCVEMDLTNFKVYNDDILVFEDDFTENTLTYPTTSASLGNFHINSVLNETKCYRAEVNSIKMDSSNESIVNSYNLTKQKNVSVPYELNYSVKVDELAENSFYGFGFNLTSSNSRIDEKNAVGFIKRDNSTAEVVAIKNGVVDRSNNYQIALSKLGIGKYKNYTVTLDYSNGINLTIDGLTYKFSNLNGFGLTGVGLVDLNSTDNLSSVIELKSFVLNQNSYIENTTEDVSNTFLGVKPVEDEEYDDPYLNRQKYFLGSGVTLKRDNSTRIPSIRFSRSTPYSAFGYRKQYSEFICEFDLDVRSRTEGNMIGLSFGRQSIVDVLVQASTSSNAFILRCDIDDNKNPYASQTIWGKNAKFTTGTDYQTSPINIYDADNTKYHMLFIAKNRTVYVYYKAANAPDSELSIPRAIIPDVNTDGYVSIVGNNNAAFNVSNYKMVNLSDACNEESDITLRETFDDSSVSSKISLTSATVSDGKVKISNNGKVSTTNETLYETIRFTTYEMTNGLNINFSKDKYLRFDVATKKIIISENGVETKYDSGSMNLNNIRGKRFEITIQGDKLTLGYKGYYDPQDQLSAIAIEHTFASALQKDTISFVADGTVQLDDLYLFALDNSMECATLNYDDDQDNANIWTVKSDFDPSKVYGANKSGCSGSVGSISGLMISLLGALLICKKKEK